MLRIDEACNAAPLLHLCHHMQRHGRLTGGLRPVDLDHTALRKAAQSQGNIQAQRTCRNGLHLHVRTGISQLHHCTLAILLLYLSKRCIQRL